MEETKVSSVYLQELWDGDLLQVFEALHKCKFNDHKWEEVDIGPAARGIIDSNIDSEEEQTSSSSKSTDKSGSYNEVEQTDGE